MRPPPQLLNSVSDNLLFNLLEGQIIECIRTSMSAASAFLLLSNSSLTLIGWAKEDHDYLSGRQIAKASNAFEAALKGFNGLRHIRGRFF